MTRLFLIIVMVTQLGCASVFWQTIGGTVIGNIVAEEIRDKLLDKEDDESPNVPADGTVGIDSDDNLYILKP